MHSDTPKRRPRAPWATSLFVAILGFVAAAHAQQPTEDFDHTATRFVLTGSHMGVPCEGCHAKGVFRGTPTECGICHDGSGMRAETGRPFDHVPSSNDCESCHVTFTWLEVRFDHMSVTGSCKSCHNGVQAAGLPLGHITTTGPCDFCHNTFSWEGVRFDHSGVTGTCSSCHNGSTARGTPPGHLTTTAECDFCHVTRRWDDIRFDHSVVTGSCSSCHDGMMATGTPNNHFMSTQECDVCHTTTAWSPDTFRHMSPNYPGDHARDLDCRECHPGNSDPVVYTDDPSLAPDCGGCHRNDFRPGPHKKWENPDTFYTAADLADCTGACHIFTDSSMTTIKTQRNGEHRVRDRSFGN